MKKKLRNKNRALIGSNFQKKIIRALLFFGLTALLITFFFGDHGLYHLYTLRAERNKIQKEITSTNSISDVVKKYSIDPEVLRGSGDFGWIPKGVKPDLDYLFFGENDQALKPKELSEPFVDQENSVFKFYVISDVSESFELSEENFEIISESILTNFFNEKSQLVDMQYGLDNETFNWINDKVKVASIFNNNDQSNVIIE